MALRKLSLIIFIIVIPQLLPALDLDLEGIQFNSGTAIILNAEDITVSPAPFQVCSLLGVSVPMKFGDVLYFEPGLRIFFMNVLLDSDTYKPVPAAIETKDRISVINIEIRQEIGAEFDISETMHFGLTGAPNIMLRFPLTAFDDAGETEKTAVLEYYFSSLRFLDIYAGVFWAWDFADNMVLKLKAGTDIPIYHIWDGDDADFYDQMRITPELSFLWRF